MPWSSRWKPRSPLVTKTNEKNKWWTETSWQSVPSGYGTANWHSGTDENTIAPPRPSMVPRVPSFYKTRKYFGGFYI